VSSIQTFVGHKWWLIVNNMVVGVKIALLLKVRLKGDLQLSFWLFTCGVIVESTFSLAV